jgi:hypothetical protein
MEQACNLHGDPIIFRGGASKQCYLQKNIKNDYELVERVDPAKPGVNSIQNRTEHPFRKNNSGKYHFDPASLEKKESER